MKCFKVPLNSVCDFMIPRVNLGAPQGPAGLAAQFGPLESRVIEDNSLRDPNPGCARANLGAADLIRGKGSVEMQSPTKRLLSPCRAAPTWEPCTSPCCRQPWLPQDPPPPPQNLPWVLCHPWGAKHHVLGTGCSGGAVPGAGSIFPARGDPEGRELCLPKVGHAVNSSDVVGRAKNTSGAESFPGSCQGPRPPWVRLWPPEGHQGPAGARLDEEQVMERPLWAAGAESMGEIVSLLMVYKSWQVGPCSLHRPFCEPGMSHFHPPHLPSEKTLSFSSFHVNNYWQKMLGRGMEPQPDARTQQSNSFSLGRVSVSLLVSCLWRALRG